MRIAEAYDEKNVGKIVRLIGVAVESTIPRTTRGTDCFCAVRIIDESHPTGIRIQFFLANMEALPLVRHVGDIVVVSNVKISRLPNTHDPNNYYVCAVFNKRSSTFALIEGGCSNINCVPYHISPNYRLSDEQMRSIVELQRCPLADRIEGIFGTVSMCEIEDGKDFNLICKILHIAQVDGNKWVLFIWNGTDTPTLHINTTLEDEIENPLPLMLEPLPRDTLCTFPTVGSIVKMTVDEGIVKLGVQYLKTGKWMKLIKIKFQTYSAMWCAVLTSESKLYYFPDDHHTAIECQKSYEKRKHSKWLRWPITIPHPMSFITEIDNPNAMPLTLMDVLTCSTVSMNFRCIVRVVALMPCMRDGFESTCNIYMIRLTLEDPTARLHAVLYGKNMVNFFGDIHSFELLSAKWSKLLGLKESTMSERSPPWIDCCFFSDYTNENDKLGSRRYNICRTRMK